MMKLPGFDVEGKVVAAVVGRLVVLAADLVTAKVTQKQCSNSAMSDDGDVTAAVS